MFKRFVSVIAVIGFVCVASAQTQTQLPAGRKIALLVGVSNYGGTLNTDPTRGSVTDLRMAHSDATKLFSVLQNLGWEPRLAISGPGGTDQIALASKERIMNLLKEIAADSRPEDTFLFYFSGHGMTLDGEGYLWPSDGFYERAGVDWNPRLKSLISFRELEDVFKTMKSRKRVLVSDACREERRATATRALTSTAEEPVQKDKTDISKLNSKLGEVVSADFLISSAALYSCIVGEYSWETERGGVYTEALVEALERDEESVDARGRITPALVKTSAAKKVAAWAQLNGKRQTPEAVIRERDPIILGVRKLVVPTPAPSQGTDLTSVGAVLQNYPVSTTQQGTEDLTDSISLLDGSIVSRTNLDRWHKLVYRHTLIDRDATDDQELARFDGETTLAQKNGSAASAAYDVSFRLREWTVQPYKGGAKKKLSFPFRRMEVKLNRQAGYGKPTLADAGRVADAEKDARNGYWKAFKFDSSDKNPEGYFWGMYYGAVTEVVAAAFRFGVNREERERREYRSAYIDNGILYVTSGNAKGEGRKLQYDVKTGFLLQIEDTEIVTNPNSNRKVKKTHLIVLDANKSMIRK